MQKTSLFSLLGALLLSFTGFAQSTWDYRYEFLGTDAYQSSTSNSISEVGTDYYVIANMPAQSFPSNQKAFGILQADVATGVAAIGQSFVYGHTETSMEGNAIHSTTAHSFVTGYYDNARSMLLFKRDNATGAVLASKGVYINDISYEVGVDIVLTPSSPIPYMAVGYTGATAANTYPMIVTFDVNLGLHQVAYYPQTRTGSHVVSQGIHNSQGDVILVGAFRPTDASGTPTGPGELFTMKINVNGVVIGSIKYYPIQGSSCIHPSIQEIGTTDEYLVAYGDGTTTLFLTQLNSARNPIWGKSYDLSLGMGYTKPIQVMRWNTGDITIAFSGTRISGNWVTGLLELDAIGALNTGSEWYDSPVAQYQEGNAAIQNSTGGVLLATAGVISGLPGNIQLISERNAVVSNCESAIGPVFDHSLSLTPQDHSYSRLTFAHEMPVDIIMDFGVGNRYECNSTTRIPGPTGVFKKDPTSVSEISSPETVIAPTVGSIFNIKGITNDVNLIEVVGINGQVVKTIIPHSSEAALDLSGFDNGIYFVKIASGSGIDTHRIIKN